MAKLLEGCGLFILLLIGTWLGPMFRWMGDVRVLNISLITKF